MNNDTRKHCPIELEQHNFLKLDKDKRKQLVLYFGIDLLEREYDKWDYMLNSPNGEAIIPTYISYNDYIQVEDWQHHNNVILPALALAHNLNNNRRMRKYRSNDTIRDMLKVALFPDYNAYFLTLTFNNETLENTSQTTRRRYVQRFHNSAFFYLANIDYGDKEKNPESNEREHYHSIVLLHNTIDINDFMNNWTYGYYLAKPINYKSNPVKLASYLVKLQNHAIKETTKTSRLIYPKNKKENLKVLLDDLPF